MSNITLYAKIESLPEDMQQQVLEYIEFLLSRRVGPKARQKQEKISKTGGGKLRNGAAKPMAVGMTENGVDKPTFKPGFGGAKGMFVMSPDFDEPLEDFKEYM